MNLSGLRLLNMDEFGTKHNQPCCQPTPIGLYKYDSPEHRTENQQSEAGSPMKKDLISQAFQLATMSPCRSTQAVLRPAIFSPQTNEIFEQIFHDSQKPMQCALLPNQAFTNTGKSNVFSRQLVQYPVKVAAPRSITQLMDENVTDFHMRCFDLSRRDAGCPEIGQDKSKNCDSDGKSTQYTLTVRKSVTREDEQENQNNTINVPVSFYKRLTGQFNKTHEDPDVTEQNVPESLQSLIDSVNSYNTYPVNSSVHLETSNYSNGDHSTSDYPYPASSKESGDISLLSEKKRIKKPLLKKVKCKVCHKLLSNASLKIHMKAHSYKHPSKCTICNKTFIDSILFEKHEEEHKMNEGSELGETPQIRIDKDSRSNTLDMMRKNPVLPVKKNHCQYCGKRFTRNSYLKLHLRIHTGERPYGCTLCSKRFTYKRAYIEHVADHKRIKLYRCKICGKNYSRQSSFDAHRRNHRKKGEVNKALDVGMCMEYFESNSDSPKSKTENECPKSVVSESRESDFAVALDSEKLFEVRGEEFVCLICEKHFIQKRSLSIHLQSHNMNDLYTCTYCQQQIASIQSLKMHIIKHSIEIFHQSLATRQATRISVTSSTSTSHKETESSADIELEDTDKDRSVPKRSQKMMPENLNSPLKASTRGYITKPNKSGTEQVNCADDGVDDNVVVDSQHHDVTSVSEKLLLVHQKTHKPSRFVCDKCGRDYKYVSNLRKHITWHETGKAKTVSKAKCETCDKLIQLDCMKNHMKTHTEERPYQCDHCGAMFKQSTHLKMHIRVHTGYKPYQCIHCGKVFRKTGNLVVHMRNHTGERPYHCEICSKRFKHLAIYKEHLASHKGITLYQCELCGHKYKSRSGYDSHKRRIHKNDTMIKCFSCDTVYKTSQEVMNCQCSHYDSRDNLDAPQIVTTAETNTQETLPKSRAVHLDPLTMVRTVERDVRSALTDNVSASFTRMNANCHTTSTYIDVVAKGSSSEETRTNIAEMDSKRRNEAADTVDKSDVSVTNPIPVSVVYSRIMGMLNNP